jgi:dienelactone hydrolase
VGDRRLSLRTFEVILLVAALATALLTLRGLRRSRSWRMPSARRRSLRAPALLVSTASLAVALIVLVAMEGLRWQFIPVSGSAALLVVLVALRAAGRTAPLVRGVAATTALAAVVSSVLGWALPVRVLEVPTGPHEIATTTIVLRDASRSERYGPMPGGARELVVQLWYPAASGSTEGSPRAALLPGAEGFAVLAAEEFGLPSFALGHLRQVRGNAVTDAPALDADRLPLVVLSHGWTGFRVVQADLAEQLASAGYVVAAPDHTYGALLTTFPDGRSVPFDAQALPDWESTPADVYEERSRTLIATFAGDLEFIVEALRTDPPEELAGRLDGARFALLGHSTGGGAAIAACAALRGCAAVVGFDPWVDPVDPDLRSSGFDAPLLSLRTQDWTERPNEAALTALHERQRDRGVPEGRVLLSGALHRDYTLVPALSPLGRLLGLEGETPGRLTRAATIVWTQRFVDHHLRGIGVDPLLDPPALEVGILEQEIRP